MKPILNVALAVALCGCSSGPNLGRVAEVVITETGNDKPDDVMADCEQFKLSPAQARAYLNRAIIVTGYEIHDFYSWSPCYVKGTAEIRGLPATWQIRKFGTGYVALLDGSEYVYSLVDSRVPREDRE